MGTRPRVRALPRVADATGRSASPDATDATEAAYRRLHADATRLLLAWRAPSIEQEAQRLDLLTHLRSHPDAMAKSGPPAHLTASALVFDADLRRVLLTHHRKAGTWLQLGGHCEAQDAGLQAAARREVGEESGIEGVRVCREIARLDRHELGVGFGRCREHLDVQFVGVAPRGAEPVVSAESLDVRWWLVRQLPDASVAQLGALIEAGLRVIGRSRSERRQGHQGDGHG